MAIVYGRHHFEIGAFNDTKYIIDMLQKTSNRLERDRLIMFIDKLVNNKKNIKYLLDSNGIKVRHSKVLIIETNCFFLTRS